MKYFYLLFAFISSLSYLTSFTIHVNDHYTSIAGNILCLNSMIKHRADFRSINYYNKNSSICYTYNHKNNFKYLLKDKYNYLISFDIFKYQYIIILKSHPIRHNYTALDIDIRHKYNTYPKNINHFKRIDNIIYKYIYNNIIENNKNNEISPELFTFFNKY